MTDVHTKAQRSRNMSAIRGKDTKPEMLVRSLLHRLGYRFRLHRSDLPGKPDIVFPATGKIILVHGCFWHMHRCRFGKVRPSTNARFWQSKREGNRGRDRKNLRALRRAGWDVLILWECRVKRSDEDELRRMLLEFVEPRS